MRLDDGGRLCFRGMQDFAHGHRSRCCGLGARSLQQPRAPRQVAGWPGIGSNRNPTQCGLEQQGRLIARTVDGAGEPISMHCYTQARGCAAAACRVEIQTGGEHRDVDIIDTVGRRQGINRAPIFGQRWLDGELRNCGGEAGA